MNLNRAEIEIVEAGPHHADLVAILVYQLLMEVSERQPIDHAINDEELNATCHALFEDETNRFSAFLAYAHVNEDGTRKAVGVMTLTETVSLYAKGRFGQIMEFFVDPNFRSKRVGEQLLNAAIEHGKQKGWSCLEVNAPDIIGGQRAVNFYQREKFIKAGPSMRFDL